MKEDTSKPEEDGTNGERQNAQHLLQDSSLVESERRDRVKPEEENGLEEGERTGRGKESNLVGRFHFHRFVVRAYPLQARIGEDRL